MKTESFAGKSVDMKAESPWLASEDIIDAGDVKVVIEGVFKHTGAVFDDGRKQDVFSLKFQGKAKQLIVNNTNRKKLVAKFETGNVKEWIGKEIVLYVERGIKRPGGGTCCGIRVR